MSPRCLFTRRGSAILDRSHNRQSTQADRPPCDISGCSKKLISHSIGSSSNSRVVRETSELTNLNARSRRCQMKYPATGLLLAFLSFPPAVFGQSEEQHHHADTVRAEQYGSVHFPISCSGQVQQSFERGVAMLHSFEYEDADATLSLWRIATPTVPWLIGARR